MSFPPSTGKTTVNEIAPAQSSNRRHDLDALRAFAMLLGIALHASLSFFPMPWPAQDSQQSGLFSILNSVIHGFRMQLFFLLSGYFTMMMYRSRGMTALLKQRALRILFPCIVGVLTFVPLMSVVSGWAMQRPRPAINDAQQPLVDAIRAADISAVRKCVDNGMDLNLADIRFRIRPLHWASLIGNAEVVSLMIEKGADVNLANDDGNAPLHAAAFLGHADVVEELLEHGANANAVNRDGSPALAVLDAPMEITNGIAAFLELNVPEATELTKNRETVRTLLGPKTTINDQPKVEVAKASGPMGRILAGYSEFLAAERWQLSIGDSKYHLIYGRMFDHLWFLWFLCWLMVAFAIIVGLKSLFPNGDAAKLKASQLSYYWLMPATIIPQFFMGIAFPLFGPDTSTGVIPQPHLLLYYGMFFAFGVFYFESGENAGKLGRRWWILLPLALLVIFPIGLATVSQRPIAVVIQPIYAWMMSIGMMGLFRATVNRPNAVFRYMSDASYWMYLTHLPLIIGLQAIVRDWTVSPILKFLMINALSVAVLLVTYHLLVRYTWIGLVLNGRRQRSSNTQSRIVTR